MRLRFPIPAPSARVEAIGVLCPVPILRTARKIREIGPGQVLELRADDPTVLIDLPNWCRAWRHDYLGHREIGGIFHIYIRREREA